jgi:hypothetical protein
LSRKAVDLLVTQIFNPHVLPGRESAVFLDYQQGALMCNGMETQSADNFDRPDEAEIDLSSLKMMPLESAPH